MAAKAHAICFPFPFQSHINSMLKLAKLLHHKGCHITFVNTEFNHRRILESRSPDSLAGLSHFLFETIPDGLPPSGVESQNSFAVGEALDKNFLAPFCDLIAKLNNEAAKSSVVPPVTCIISDGFTQFTITAAQNLGIPIALLFTVSACGVMGFKQQQALQEKGIIPLKDESFLTNGYLDTIVDWIPGMKDMRLRDLPSSIRTTDPNDFMLNYTMKALENAGKAPSIIIHTFDALEAEVLNALSSVFPCINAIGPFQLLLNQIEEPHGLNSIGCNLRREETECLQWLDSKEPNSVVYVNFGSLTVMTEEQVMELGIGLANSKHSFLWIIRRDMVIGNSSLPPGFIEENRENGFITGWCPQEQVLNHPSIGGFLTHSGWNSTIESISSGIPMICWPVNGDQQTNCRYICSEWGIGMEMDNDVKRENVERLVRVLMEEEKGRKMKKKAMEWKRLAEEAISPTGSSSMNLDKFMSQMLLYRHEIKHG